MSCMNHAWIKIYIYARKFALCFYQHHYNGLCNHKILLHTKYTSNLENIGFNLYYRGYTSVIMDPSLTYHEVELGID